MSNLREICREHLSNKNATLWGRAFNVQDEKGLERATDWLAQEVRDVLFLRQEKMEESGGDSQEATQQPQHGSLAGV